MTETPQNADSPNSFVNLELKSFCPDFAPIREKLSEIGAQRVGIFPQKDYFFNLPQEKAGIPRRLKLRIERGAHTLVYYQRPEFTKTGSTPASVSIYQIQDMELLAFLKQALGVKAVVQKVRELWRKDNIVFNLDHVRNIGKIFEIELKVDPRDKLVQEEQFNNLRKIFEPYLGQIVKGSNLDLVLKIPKRPPDPESGKL